MDLWAKVRDKLLRQCMRFNLVQPVFWFILRAVSEVPSPAADNSPPKPTLLALNPMRFRGDLDILANSGRYRVLRFPFKYQASLVLAFYRPQDRADVFRFYAPDSTDELLVRRTRLHRYLGRLLPPLFERLGVDAVISPAIHYKQDIDIGAAAHNLKTPWIVMHRENFKASPGHRADILTLGHSYRRFLGSRLIVQNEIMRRALIESGFVSPDRISNCGCLRMDAFTAAIRMPAETGTKSRKSVVFFSFFHGVCIAPLREHILADFDIVWSKDGNSGFVELFNETHGALGELARDHPEIDFVIKPKWGKPRWFDMIRNAIRQRGIEPDQLSNLVLTDDQPVVDLIRQADVVVSFGSSTMVEAAFAGKPVIVPYFAEALSAQYRNYVHCQEDFGLFDIVASAEALKDMVLTRLAHPEINPEIERGRQELFDRYLGSGDDSALNRHAAVFVELMARRH